MKKITAVISALLIAAAVPAASAMADTGITFESEYASHEDPDSHCADAAEGVRMIQTVGRLVYVSTQTNIRQEPNADCTVLKTIGPDSLVRLWGVTDNGWDRIFCRTPDGEYIVGYIKDTLLTTEAPS